MPAPRRELTKEEITGLLTELGQRLRASGVEAQLYIVGGAAIALGIDTRRVTVDIDAVFHPETSVRDEATAMAAEHGLPAAWLNDSVKAFVPGDDVGSVPLAVPGLAVAVASPEHLLAMKMAAYRPGTDQRDLELLFGVLSITSAEQAADLCVRVYGEHTVVLPSHDELVLSAQAVLDRLARARRRR
jgi:hypothetical protein